MARSNQNNFAGFTVIDGKLTGKLILSTVRLSNSDDVFESRIIGSPLNESCWTYSSIEDAMKGHCRIKDILQEYNA